MLWNFWNLWIYPLLAHYLVIMISFWYTYVFQTTFGISSLRCQGEKYQKKWVKLCCSNNPYISEALNNKSWFLTHTANYGWASVTLCQVILPRGTVYWTATLYNVPVELCWKWLFWIENTTQCLGKMAFMIQLHKIFYNYSSCSLAYLYTMFLPVFSLDVYPNEFLRSNYLNIWSRLFKIYKHKYITCMLLWFCTYRCLQSTQSGKSKYRPQSFIVSLGWLYYYYCVHIYIYNYT